MRKFNMEKRETIATWKIVAISFVILVLFYLGWIQVWKATSPNYQPTDFIDSQVKTPENPADWFKRRLGGV